ncbi:MAG: hypothetical protein ACXWWC_13445 [Chitinophagaceae bacterium]
MKKQFFRYTTGCIPLIAMFSCAFAQNGKPSSILTGPISTELAYNSNSKMMDMPWNTSITEGTNTVSSNLRAAKEFNKTYKKPVNVSWSVIADGNIAEFKQNGITTKVFYDGKGKWTGTLRSFLEDKMPRHIRHLVKSQYYDYSIYYVHEITVPDKIAYLVKIEDKTSLKTIRVLDGMMTEVEAFEKSK